jgi:hypothetical protein
MDADMLEKSNGGNPFRSIEVPKEFLESILFIPANLDHCPCAPTIKIERKLSRKQIEKMMAEDEERCKIICQTLGVDALGIGHINYQFKIPTFKEALIRKDILLLSEIVATDYYSKIRGQKYDWRDLRQTIETDWSLRDFYPDQEDAIHYEIFTKREIYIKTREGSVHFG